MQELKTNKRNQRHNRCTIV